MWRAVERIIPDIRTRCEITMVCSRRNKHDSCIWLGGSAVCALRGGGAECGQEDEQRGSTLPPRPNSMSAVFWQVGTPLTHRHFLRRAYGTYGPGTPHSSSQCKRAAPRVNLC